MGGDVDEAAAVAHGGGDAGDTYTFVLRKKQSSRTSPASSLSARRSARASIHLVGRALVRSASCFGFKSKSAGGDADRYAAYGVPEDANDSFLEMTPPKSALSTPTDRFEIQYHDIGF